MGELEAASIDLNKSKLFKIYNSLGKYEEDLDKRLQLIELNSIIAPFSDLYTIYDLENFKINILVKFKGDISGNTQDRETNPLIDEDGDGDNGINSGMSANQDILKNIVNEFFPESNVFVANTSDAVDATSKIRYETIVKFQFINKMKTEDDAMLDVINP